MGSARRPGGIRASDARKACADFDGGSQKTYQRMVQSMDAQVGRVLQALDARRADREHHRHLHQRQRRRTLLRHVAFHRPQDRAARRRSAHSLIDLVAGADSQPAQQAIRCRSRMDWMPTLLAAAGVPPDQAFASDGIDLLPVLTRRTPPVPRKLFWRYKANAQRAARDGDYKYPENSRQHLSVQSRGRSDGARQPEGAPARTSTTAWSRSGTSGTRPCSRK